MRKFLLLPLILCLSGPAHAELSDIRARLAGETGRIWLAFDEQPSHVSATSGPQGVVLAVHGVSDISRSIEPAHRDLVNAIRIIPETGHLRIELSAAREWRDARAEVRQGGILIEVGVTGSTIPLARIRSGGSNAARAALTNPASATASAADMSGAASAAQTAMDQPDIARPTITAPEVPQAPAVEPPAPVAATTPAAPEAPAAPSVPVQLAPDAPEVQATAQEQDRCASAAAAVEADPWNDAALMIHAGCLAEAGSRREAAGIYAQMLAFEPENTEAALALAEIHVAEGNRAEAAALYRQVAGQSRSDAAAAAALQRARELEQ
ncbi:tetratricopeptide repeat protein [Maricaulis sp.]|uniref:tetratricopeptide repeat protein n=1 Tax=Maricaulis sp. TaxID=1486257 RepID=UPI002636F8B4|nr:tetratricopeptide repeat protein [Maricaulis sp.]